MNTPNRRKSAGTNPDNKAYPAKNTDTTSPTATLDTKQQHKTADIKVLKDLSLGLLTPAQFEAITKANYYTPDARLVLQLFLHTNYLWQLSRKIQNQNKPAAIETINWPLIEKNSAHAINESLNKLLAGVNLRQDQPLQANPDSGSKPKTKTRSTLKSAKPRLACGCASHSDAAGVVDACILGQQQAQDEWTGY